MAGRQVSRAATQEGQPAAEPAENGVGREDPRLRGGEFDREWQAVQSRDDLRDRRCGRRGHLKVPASRPSAFDEQQHALVLRELGDRREMRRVRDAQGRHWVLLLASDVKPAPARNEDPQLRGGSQDCRDRRCRVLELLEIVKDEQHVPIPKRISDRVQDRSVGGLP